MIYELFFSDESLEDIKDSYNWYEDQRAGLGDEFLACMDKSIEHVVSNPYLYQEIGKGTRAVIIARFPYRVLYFLSSNQIIIQGILRMSRAPESWKKRNK